MSDKKTKVKAEVIVTDAPPVEAPAVEVQAEVTPEVKIEVAVPPAPALSAATLAEQAAGKAVLSRHKPAK